MNKVNDHISLVLIKYGNENQFVDFVNYTGNISYILLELQKYFDENIPLVYSREKLIGEYIKEVDSSFIFDIFRDLKDHCNLFTDKILIEYVEKLKYIKISYYKKRLNSKTEDFNYFIDLYDSSSINSNINKNQIQVKHDLFSGYYIVYFTSILKNNFLKSKFKSTLPNSALKVYDLISRSNYPMAREEIVSNTMLSPRTVSYACKELVERNLIEKINDRNYSGNSNKTNKYYKKEL